MDSATKEILKELRKTGSTIARYESHFNFLFHCIELNKISKGFHKKTNVTYAALKRECQDIQDEASWKQQWLGPQIKQTKKIFNKLKGRLFLTGKLYMKVNNDMKRLFNKLDRIKEKKSNRDQINFVTSLYEENINENHHQENINEDHHQENINEDHHQNEESRITSQNYNNITNRKHYRRGRKCKNKYERGTRKRIEGDVESLRGKEKSGRIY